MLPPQNLEAEQSVLGCMMITKKCALASKDFSVDDFYFTKHKPILEAIQQLVEEGQAVDLITVTDKLTEQEKLGEAGGGAYISELSMAIPSAANFEYYKNIVKENSFRRKVILQSNEILKQSYQSHSIEDVKQRIYELNTLNVTGSDRTYKTAKELALETINDLENRMKGNIEGLDGVLTGFKDLDDMIICLEPGDLCIVAGRPSMGKTAFALNILDYVATSKEKPCVIFSLEMDEMQLMHRLLAKRAEINLTKIRSGDLSNNDWLKVTKTFNELSKLPIIVDDTPAVSPVDIELKLNQIITEYGEPSIVVVDYLQIMGALRDNMGEVEAVTKNSQAMKAIAKRYKVPVILLSQLNRAPEIRDDKRPRLADLRQSGSIEQDADIVMFLYRDDYYNPDTDEPNTTEVIISKQRNGPVGTIKLVWQGQYQKFLNKSMFREVDEPMPWA